MINRFGKTTDLLGVSETMRDVDKNFDGLNVSAKFYLSFVKSKEEVLSMIH